MTRHGIGHSQALHVSMVKLWVRIVIIMHLPLSKFADCWHDTMQWYRWAHKIRKVIVRSKNKDGEKWLFLFSSKSECERHKAENEDEEKKRVKAWSSFWTHYNETKTTTCTEYFTKLYYFSQASYNSSNTVSLFAWSCRFFPNTSLRQVSNCV